MVLRDLSAYPLPYPDALNASADPGADATPPIDLTAERLRERIGGNAEDLPMVESLLAAASLRVNQYAPHAPTALKNEAVIRFAGYMMGSDFGGVKSESIGPRAVEYTPPSNNAAMFRNSGAAGLLTTYRRRRGGAI